MRPPALKIGISGVRGIAGESLTPRIVTSFAAAFGTWCGPGTILIGTDTRPSREMLAQAAVAGLLSVGSTPVCLGIVPLPSLQYHARHSDAVGAVCVTASHNLVEWNALKFFGPDGSALRPSQFAELTDLYHQGFYPRVRAEDIRETRTDASAVAKHRAGVLAAVDAGLIRSRRLTVAVDCCNGAAAEAAPEFLRALGCRVIEVHTNSAAPFPRNPEPAAENLEDLCRAVAESGAAVGLALDADADRLAIVGERGRPLGEDCTVALAADHLLGRRGSPVVVSLPTSRLVDEIARRHGSAVHRTRVGESHVVERMHACGAAIGGEGNGGVVVPAVNPCRDGFVAMALLLEMIAERRAGPEEIRSQWPPYAMVKRRMPCRARDVAAFLRLMRHLYRDDELDLTDGVLVRRPDRWLHIRGSNTEPVLRIIAEAPTDEEAQGLVQHALTYLRSPG